MNNYKLTYKQFNENSILIEWPEKIALEINNEVHVFAEILRVTYKERLVDTIPAYQSLTLVFKEQVDNLNKLIDQFEELYSNNEDHKSYKPVTWELPVCYETTYAPDLETLAKLTKLSQKEIIRLHSETLYTVYFIGFLPGFLYLGGLNKLLHIPRKETPSRKVSKGAVAIGGMQTGIYPEESPGGWYVIGNSPITLFDSSKAEPTPIRPRDKIKFIPITENEYNNKHQLLRKKYD